MKKRWATFALLVFALHFGWEMGQAKWFANMAALPVRRAILVCLQASAGDLLITAICYALASATARNARWPLGGLATMAATVFVLLGIMITAGVEVFAIRTSRWRYDDKMPTIFGLGLLPLFQWIVLPVLEISLFRLIWRSGGSKSLAEGRGSSE